MSMFGDKGFRFARPAVMAAALFLGLAGFQGLAGADGDGVRVADSHAYGQTESKPEPGAQANPAPAPPPLTGGPKQTVAVGKFDAVGSFTQKYGDWDIGGGLAAMLTSELVKSGQFVVIERAELSQVLSEQELKASGVVNRETGPKLGKLAGVQLMIYGAVTEFGAQDKGGGLNLGVSGLGGLPFKLGGATESASGKVAMDVRVVGTTTGEVLESHTVSEAIENSAFNLSAGYSGISLGGDQFEKTPLGEATRGAIKKAVAAIIATSRKTPWTGLVVDVDGKEVYINAGSRSGLEKGTMFMIERIAKTFTDPATGQVLGTRKKELGVLTLTGVQPKLAFGAYSPLDNAAPKRGDLVVIMSR